MSCRNRLDPRFCTTGMVHGHRRGGVERRSDQVEEGRKDGDRAKDNVSPSVCTERGVQTVTPERRRRLRKIRRQREKGGSTSDCASSQRNVRPTCFVILYVYSSTVKVLRVKIFNGKDKCFYYIRVTCFRFVVFFPSFLFYF